MVAASAVATAAPTYRAMLETPDAPPTWFSGTEAVAADEDGPFDSPMPTAMATSGSRNAAYFHEASTKPTMTKPAVVSANPSADRLPAAELRGEAGHQRGDHHQPDRRGQRGQPRLERAEVQRGGVLEVEAEQVHQAVDRARADQDRDRGADQDPVAQQREVQQRHGDPSLDGDEARNRRRPRSAKQPSVAAESHPQSPLLVTPRMSGISVSATSTVPA